MWLHRQCTVCREDKRPPRPRRFPFTFRAHPLEGVRFHEKSERRKAVRCCTFIGNERRTGAISPFAVDLGVVCAGAGSHCDNTSSAAMIAGWCARFSAFIVDVLGAARPFRTAALLACNAPLDWPSATGVLRNRWSDCSNWLGELDGRPVIPLPAVSFLSGVACAWGGVDGAATSA